MSDQQPDPNPKSNEPPGKAVAVVDSHALLNGARELRILHGTDVYRLCHTRNDKLILTK